MLIRVGYEIEFEFPSKAEALFSLFLHPSIIQRVAEAEEFKIEPSIPFQTFTDPFGNACGRAELPAGRICFTNDAVVEDSGLPDWVNLNAKETRVSKLPPSALPFLLASRYCEVDSELNEFAWSKFGSTSPGWARVQAICNFVHNHMRFDYLNARRTRTALEAYRERTGVCRDFMHLAITLCRCMNIPARYATGYLGDIGVPPVPCPMDFSAWFEVFLDEHWYTFDARHNARRIGRVLMAIGRDAADVALTTTFGPNMLTKFKVWTDEVQPNAVFSTREFGRELTTSV